MKLKISIIVFSVVLVVIWLFTANVDRQLNSLARLIGDYSLLILLLITWICVLFRILEVGIKRSLDALNTQQLLRLLAGVSIVLLIVQLHKNSQSNLATIRSQLYSTEQQLFEKESQFEDGDADLSLVYAPLSKSASPEEYIHARLKPLTGLDVSLLPSERVEDLYYKIIPDGTRVPYEAAALKKLKQTFFHVQTITYHMHNAHDYWSGGMSKDEWDTWKGSVAEMGAHPLLIAVIWQGHEFRYYSKEFGEYLKESLLEVSNTMDEEEIASQERNRKVIQRLYPEMLDNNWAEKLPSY